MPTLNWLNREEALSISSKVPYRLLEPVKKYSCGDSDLENMLIQGDNLETLKALLPYYAGRVKCIYIDPPYNTQNAFEHYDDNLEHSQWLTMMYPRLELLRELLDPKQGSLWISIDDDECHYLKALCDEVFGRKNFVANVIWEKKYSPQNDAKWLSDNHDHILVYAKNKDCWRPNLLPRTEAMDARYKNPDNDPRGPWKPADLSVKTYSANNDYPITLPSRRVVTPPESRCWVISKERLREFIADNRIWFGKSGNNVPSLKKFLSEVKDGTVSKTIWFRDEVGDNQEAKKETKEFNEEDVFQTPKPERLVQRVLELGSKEGDLVLDSFLGSGTTAAVAHKMGRRYIGIEMGEHAVTHCYERLKKVVEGEKGGISEAQNWKGGGGFHFYRLGPTIFAEDGKIRQDIPFATLAAHVWFSETRIPLNKTPKSPFLGESEGKAYYLLFNGILGDKASGGGNVLTTKILRSLPKYSGPKVIYGELSLLNKEHLKREMITFKQIPYDVRIR